jgi:ribosomal-protein-alanine N-acetyltransferase
MEIRPMLLSDLDQVIYIENQSMPSPWTKELFEEELGRSLAFYFVAVENQQIAGYIGFWEAPQEAHVITLATHSLYRNQKIATRLLAFCIEFSRKRGARLMTLEVRASNQIAQHLYEKCMFRLVAIRKGYYADTGEDAWVMYRDLIE